MNLTTEQHKKLTDMYPYLLPRNVWTGEELENYDYSWIVGESELPQGWFRLFLLYCKNIKHALADSNWIDRFMFTQVKEKYGTMRLYNNGAPEYIHRMTMCYEQYSTNICERCGSIATVETKGWISSLCDECDLTHNPYQTTPLIQRHFAGYSSYDVKQKYEYGVYYSLKEIDKEYKQTMTLSDEEFIHYILN